MKINFLDAVWLGFGLYFGLVFGLSLHKFVKFLLQIAKNTLEAAIQ